MNVHTQISDYLAAQPERKRDDMQTLHGMMLRLMPDCRLWFLDGKDEGGRTVSNPNIGVWTAYHRLRRWANPRVLSDWPERQHDRHLRLHHGAR